MTFNSNLPHAEERNVILGHLTGAMRFGGDVTVDNDDEDGHFTITHRWVWNDHEYIKIIKAQLVVTDVAVSKEKI